MSRLGRFIVLVAGLWVMALSGCAKLSVRVDMLNSAYWASPQYVNAVTLAKITNVQEAILDGSFTKDREKLKEDVKQALQKANVGSELPGIMSQFTQKIDEDFKEARGYFQAAFNEASTAGQATSHATALYAQGAEKLTLLVSTLSKDLRTLLRLSENSSSEALQTFEQKGNVTVEGLIGGAGILDDPRAAAVVYAPNEYWTRQINHTLCYGEFGNTDCAVKMESIGDFTLKGVRLDASKITQATFSVTREAIQTVAAVYGVPIPKAQPATTTPGGKESDSQVTEEVASPAKRQRDSETAILQLRLARLAMFDTIVLQRQAISVDATRAQAIKTIKEVLSANSKQLDPDLKPETKAAPVP